MTDLLHEPDRATITREAIGSFAGLHPTLVDVPAIAVAAAIQHGVAVACDVFGTQLDGLVRRLTELTDEATAAIIGNVDTAAEQLAGAIELDRYRNGLDREAVDVRMRDLDGHGNLGGR